MRSKWKATAIEKTVKKMNANPTRFELLERFTPKTVQLAEHKTVFASLHTLHSNQSGVSGTHFQEQEGVLFEHAALVHGRRVLG